MKVKQIMNKKVIVCNSDDTISAVIEKFKINEISGMPVIKFGKVIGIITERDIFKMIKLEHSNNELPSNLLDIVRHSLHDHVDWNCFKSVVKNVFNNPVHAVMTKKVYTISEGENIEDAEAIMSKYNINRLPVIDKDGTLVGIVTRGDIIIESGFLKRRSWDVDEIVKDYNIIHKME